MYGYIYIHLNTVNGHRYVGQSIQDPKRRFRKTQKALNSYKTCPAMLAALDKYGWDKFETEIVYHAFDQEALNKAEEYFINLYNTADGVHGYNTVKFSEGRGKQADSTKEKIRQRQLNHNNQLKEQGIIKVATNRKEYKIIDGVQYKHCSRKDHWLELDKFGKDSSKWDNLGQYCKTCHAAVSLEQKNQRKILLTSEQWCQSYVDRKDKMVGGLKEFYKTNPEAVAAMSKRNSKAVKRIDMNTLEEKIYESALAAKADGFDNTYVSQCCNGRRAFYKGYKWRFV